MGILRESVHRPATRFSSLQLRRHQTGQFRSFVGSKPCWLGGLRGFHFAKVVGPSCTIGPMPIDGPSPVRSRRGCGPRWLVSRVPQFADLPDGIRGRMYDRCSKRAFKHWQVWLISSVYIVLGFLGLWIARAWLFFGHNYTGAVAVGVYSIGGLVLPEVLKTRFLVRHLREEIGGICLLCGYDLRATTDRCPECGASVPHVQHPT